MINQKSQEEIKAYLAKARTYWNIVGEANFKKLIDDFYDGVKEDEVLRPMYPEEDLSGAKERLYLFIIMYFGGPSTYWEKRGHPALKARHRPFKVDERAQKRWMFNMGQAMKKNPMDQEAKEFIMEYFRDTAVFLRNSE